MIIWPQSSSSRIWAKVIELKFWTWKPWWDQSQPEFGDWERFASCLFRRWEEGGGRLDCLIRPGCLGRSEVVTGVTIPEGTDIIVTDAIESLSSAGSGSGSILLVLCSLPLHLVWLSPVLVVPVSISAGSPASVWLFPVWLFPDWLFPDWLFPVWLFPVWLFPDWLFPDWLFPVWLFPFWLFPFWLFPVWLFPLCPSSVWLERLMMLLLADPSLPHAETAGLVSVSWRRVEVEVETGTSLFLPASSRASFSSGKTIGWKQFSAPQ